MLALLERGHEVAGSVRSREGRNAEAVAELEAAGARVVEMDVTDTRSTGRGAAEAIAALGGLDVLFNNAGIGSYGIQELLSPEDMSRVFDVNVTGVQRVMRATLPHMRTQGRGTTLYTSSLIGRIATPLYGTYSASKWALEAIVECYRTELSDFGIESCIIEPGAMPTAFFDGMVAPDDPDREACYGDFAQVPAMSAAGLAQMLDATPAQRPERIAEAVVALLDMPHGQKPFRMVVDHTGVGPQIERYNDVLRDVTRTVLTDFSIERMLDLITGASSGIGKATALRSQAEGWNVIATMRDASAGCGLAALENVRVAGLDVTDVASIATAVAKGLSRFGKIDVLLNNADYGAYGPLEAFSAERIRRQFDTNVIGLPEVRKAVLPNIRGNRSGTIVNISSIGGQITFPLGMLYHGTKFAVEGLSEALHYELEPHPGREAKRITK